MNATVPFIVSDDIDAAADALRPFYALYFGGMGAKGTNFHANVAIRMGYEAEVDQIAELYLEGKKDEAAGKVPRKLIEDMSLIGPKEKIRDDLERWRESIVDDAADLRRRRHPASGRRARPGLSAEPPKIPAGRALSAPSSPIRRDVEWASSVVLGGTDSPSHERSHRPRDGTAGNGPAKRARTRPARRGRLRARPTSPRRAAATWLIADQMDRERMLDMDRLVAPVRQKSFVVIALALLICGPWLGWWTIAPLAVAAIFFRVADGSAERLHSPRVSVVRCLGRLGADDLHGRRTDGRPEVACDGLVRDPDRDPQRPLSRPGGFCWAWR